MTINPRNQSALPLKPKVTMMLFRRDDRDSFRKYWGILPFLYFTTMLPTIIFLAFLRQPIGVPDEWAHVARAAQLADGHILTQSIQAGKPPMGSIDPSLLALSEQVHARRHEILATLLPDLEKFRWSPEKQLTVYNSSVYFPAPYVVSVLAIKLGHVFNTTIVDTLRLASLLNGIFCGVVTAAAIALAPRAKAVIALVALLPSTIYLYASASPDGPLISAGLLTFAILTRVLSSRQSKVADYVFISILSIVVVATKLPYLPLFTSVLLAMWLGSEPATRPRFAVPLLGMFFLIGIPLGWSILTKSGAIDIGVSAANSSQQIAYLVGHPATIITIAKKTISVDGWTYLYQMIGSLGWLDAEITLSARNILLACLGAILLLDGASKNFAAPNVLILLGCATSVGAVFLSLYAMFNPVASAGPIAGVQGRYFLPLLPFVAFLIPSARARGVIQTTLTLILIIAAPLSTLETMRTVILRYYL